MDHAKAHSITHSILKESRKTGNSFDILRYTVRPNAFFCKLCDFLVTQAVLHIALHAPLFMHINRESQKIALSKQEAFVSVTVYIYIRNNLSQLNALYRIL